MCEKLKEITPPIDGYTTVQQGLERIEITDIMRDKWSLRIRSLESLIKKIKSTASNDTIVPELLHDLELLEAEKVWSENQLNGTYNNPITHIRLNSGNNRCEQGPIHSDQRHDLTREQRELYTWLSVIPHHRTPGGKKK